MTSIASAASGRIALISCIESCKWLAYFGLLDQAVMMALNHDDEETNLNRTSVEIVGLRKSPQNNNITAPFLSLAFASLRFRFDD
jgi:hypothetical protein